jgi:transcriptional regulator with PAS, ATPase and Fis domain
MRNSIQHGEDGSRIIGSAPGFLQALSRTRLLAASDVTILIIGETGTGKELIARSLHYQSRRAGKPFVPINCAALPESLIESELFGHEQGAFTDARRAQRGMVGVSDHGTLMLDEVDSLSPKGQAALLRFLQDGLYRPVGGTEFRRADLRIVAATNSNLEALVEQCRFRRD